jgi:hypothetical protein
MPPAAAATSRRHEPRFPIEGRLSVDCLDPAPLGVHIFRDISFGGFSIETLHPVSDGVTRTFEFRGPRGLSVVARARATYCHDTGEGRYLSGWTFVRQRDLDVAIESLIDERGQVLN